MQCGMMSYIDTKYLGKCETCRHHRSGTCNTFCDCVEEYSPDLSKIPTADVVPKSEVERLTINMNAYGLTAKRLAEENESLKIELENMRRNLGDAREGWNDAECEVDRLRKALDAYEETSGLKQAKQEFAREIFEAINEDCFDQFGYFEYEAYAELKKKYTEKLK